MTEFASQYPLMTAFLAWMAAYAFVMPFRLYFRSLNIRAHGWPPDHLDADGDIHRRTECDCDKTSDIQQDQRRSRSV